MNIFETINLFSRYIGRVNDVDVVQMCGLAKGTTTATLKTRNDVVFNAYNSQQTLTAQDNIGVTPCASQNVSTTCYYLVSVDVSKTVYVTKSSDNVFVLPQTPTGNVAIGAFAITTDAVNIFTAGETDFGAAGITATFYDIDCGVASLLLNQTIRKIERGITITRNGRQRTLANYDHMLVRATASLAINDSSVVIPFPRYKEFQQVMIIDSVGVETPIKKEDVLPVGVTVQGRPVRISRLPSIETVFTPDGIPAFEFDIWPVCDQAYTLDAIAYQYSPSLDGVLYQTNWWTQNAFDIVVHGALVEAAPYFKNDERIPVWKTYFEDALWALYESQQQQKSAGSKIHTKFPDPLKQKGAPDGVATSYIGMFSYGFIDDES